MIDRLRGAATELEARRLDGVSLDSSGGTGDDYARLVTTNPEVAKKYGMHDEAEFMDDDGIDETKDAPSPDLPEP